MERVQFTLKRGGRKQLVPLVQAKALQRAGFGTYETRDMARAPARAAVAPAVAAVSRDYLDDMEEVPLRALALERGLELHHRVKLDTVRAAIRALPPVAPPAPPEPEVPVFTSQPAGPTE